MKKLPEQTQSNKRKGRPEGLNLREAMFCLEYVATNGNGKQSAIAAGYTGDPTVRASELLARPRVMAVIDRYRTEKLSELDARAEKVLREVVRIAFFCIKGLFRPDGSQIPLSELDPDTAAAICGIDFKDGVVSKYRFASKVQALELLGNYLRLWEGAGNSQQDELEALVHNIQAPYYESKKEG